MEKKSRRRFTAEFKAKVAIEAIKERYSIEEIARRFEIHPHQVGTWKREFLNKASHIFASTESHSEDKKQQDVFLEKLYAQIGQQKMEIDWLKKKLL
jgi:transposase